MTTYLEAEENDAELRQAVEAIVETAAVTVYADLQNDFWNATVHAKEALEWLLPRLVEYQQDRAILKYDLQCLLLYGVLWLVGVLALTPVRWKRKPPREEEDSLATPLDDEYDSFEDLYPSIATSQYRRLVLPPSCRLVERPARKRLPSVAASKPKDQPPPDDEDNPARRLQNYGRLVWYLARSFFTYDYAGAMWTLLTWLHLRRQQRAIEPDGDDQSVASSVLPPPSPFGTPRGGSGTHSIQETVSVCHTLSPLPEEEKKEACRPESIDRQSSDYHDTQHISWPTSESQREQSIRPTTYFFETANSQDTLERMNVEAPLPDANGYILGDEFLPNSRCTPLLVFVNSKSGPQQGQLLITQLRRLLNPIQIWDLADGPPEPILESFSVLTRLRILVCGGDGTVSWIISALERIGLQKWPPIAILPLGTGNDLARIHGWGGGYSNEPLIGILEQIAESYMSLLDRWDVTILEKNKEETKSFFNYLGVGADAQAALQVHNLRESRPEWFFSRIVNKAWYGIFGAEDILKSSSIHTRKDITLIADGVEVPIPPDSQGIILLNIDSYAGGVPLWSHGVKADSGRSSVDSLEVPELIRRTQSLDQMRGRNSSIPSPSSAPMNRIDSMDDLFPLSSEDQLADILACELPSSCQDGLLDIVSIRGAFHLGQIKVGLSNAQRLCQCREVTIRIKRKVAVQVDGEPWRQKQSILRIRKKKHPALMLHRSADDGGVETEMSKLLEWAEERRLIDSQVHNILMKEFSRRIETKTRKKRVRKNDAAIFSNLRKAIGSSGALGSLNSSQQWQGGVTF